MTSSEQRLHPASILFDTARYARLFLWPALLAYFGTRSGRGDYVPDQFDYGANVETWLWVLIVPSVVLSVARYLSFRLRYEPDELVIRSGILFRNVRHLPYARIQNLDAVQNVFHRALGVVEVRVETGAGQEPEARMSVLPASALDAMRRRVFEGRSVAAATGADPVASPGPAVEDAAPAPAAASAATLLHLDLRELLLCGFLENKGMVLIGAAYGALWEAGALNTVWNWLFQGNIDARGLYREVLAALFGGAPLPVGRLVLALGGVAGFLLLVRVISMAWAFVRLYDFRLTRHGDDLRATFGLFTRVTATIPLRRVQTVTVYRGWLHRVLHRAAVRVETAGGPAGASTRDREWVAPLIHEAEVPALVAEILPGATTAGGAWQGVHPRAFRRAIKPVLAMVSVVSLAAAVVLGWRAVFVVAPLVAWAVVSTRQYVRHLAWTADEEVVAFRSGWFSRRETIVKVGRIQVVATKQSPLDRRASMAGIAVDTAGAGELSHRVRIPYLAVEVADALGRRLAAQAARTAFRW